MILPHPCVRCHSAPAHRSGRLCVRCYGIAHPGAGVRVDQGSTMTAEEVEALVAEQAAHLPAWWKDATPAEAPVAIRLVRNPRRRHG